MKPHMQKHNSNTPARKKDLGAAMVEAAVLMAMISVVAVAAIRGTGGQIGNKFDEAAEVLSGDILVIPFP